MAPGSLHRSFGGLCRCLRGFLRCFCCLLGRLNGCFGSTLGGLNGFLCGFDRTLCGLDGCLARRFCRLLNGLSAVIHRLNGFFSRIGRTANPLHGFLSLLFREVRFLLLKMVFCFGDILFCVLYALAPEFIKLVDNFTGGGFRPTRNTVGGVFIGRTLRRIKAMIRFIFGADISGFHTLGGNRPIYQAP